jgi:hypothetical protein
MKVIVENAVLSFPNLSRPQKQTEQQIAAGQKPKYSATVVLLKDHPGLPALRAAARAAAVAEWGEFITMPNGTRVAIDDAFLPEYNILRSPFRTDAVKKGYPVGSTFTNARTERKPQAVYRHRGPDGKPVEVPAEKIEDTFYSGARINVSLRAFTYDNSGNKGVSFALNNVQFHSDGERLDNRTAAVDEFTADLNEAPADLSELT